MPSFLDFVFNLFLNLISYSDNARLCYIQQKKRDSRIGITLNVAENELSVLKRVGIGKRVGSQEELKQQIADYQERRNKRGAKVEWQFTTKDARVKLRRLYPPLKP